MEHHLRIIGDVHAHKDRYLKLVKKDEYSIQVGDMAFDYEFLKSVSAQHHRFLGGNHDNYDKINDSPHYLGDYGIHTIPGVGEIFFVRGAYSVDHMERTEGVDWWREEELSYAAANMALRDYERIRPDFVITHTCPSSIVSQVVSSTWVKNTTTSTLLQEMLSIHQPVMWIFGHFHRSWTRRVERTKFICLDELECFDYYTEGD